ncbi:MAG: carboxypeptidase regulatory-like domain-containing protein [Nannocystaceae bacterium]
MRRSLLLGLGLSFPTVASAAEPPSLPADAPPQPTPVAAPGTAEAAPPEPSVGETATLPDTSAQLDLSAQPSDTFGDPPDDGFAEDEGNAPEDAGTGDGDDSDDPAMIGGRREPFSPTLRGPIGLYYTALADVGGLYTFRFRVHTSFFKQATFAVSPDSIYGADTHSRVAGSVDLGFTFTKWTEAYFGVYNQANRNERQDPNRVDPPVVFALGDITFGIKAAHKVANGGFGFGAIAGAGLLSGADKLLTDRANFNIDAIGTLDLRYLTASKAPVRLSTNIGWILDNSYKLVEFDKIDDPVSREILRFSLGVNHSRLRMRFGADFPIRFGEHRQFGIDPSIEYSWNVSTQEETLYSDLTALADEESPLPRSQGWVTVGLRSNVYDGLQIGVAADIRTTSPNYEWGPPVAPWQVILGLGWSIDPKPVIKEVEVAADAPPPTPVLDGRVIGRVVDSAGQPVAGARVSFPGLSPNAILTDENGGFISYRFPEGSVSINVEIEGSEAMEQTVDVTAEQDTQVDFAMEAPAAPAEGTMEGLITDEAGVGIAAAVQIRGQGIDEPFNAQPDGRIAVLLPVGDYTASVSAVGFDPQELSLTVTAEGFNLAVKMNRSLPAETPNVSGNKRRIRIKKRVSYQGTDVAERSFPILDELAAFLAGHPEFVSVEIRVHTDDRGNAKSRSQGRADAVRNYLVGKGVAVDRLTAVGFGARAPTAVNLTPEGRRKNNRTELRVNSFKE